MADDDELFIISQTIEDIHKNPVNSTLQLPDDILHLIFSYLSFHDLLNVRLVSKNWHRNAPSQCNFHFNEFQFSEKNPSNYLPNEFLDSIRSSIDASKNKLINAEKRVLHVQFINFRNINDLVKLLDGNDFHEVYLLRFMFQHDCDYLPYIFQSKCLTILHLTDCGLDKHALCGDEIIPSLQELKLERVFLCEEMLSKFISKYPNIRELSLVNCWGISFIVLTKLDRLKKLYVNFIDCCSCFINIQVIAPSLQVFHFVLRSLIRNINLDIRACKMLQELHLNCWKFPNGLDPENFCFDFPHLETLLLGPCRTKRPIKILGSSLRKWILSFPQLYECSRKSIVSSPNLSCFQYKGTTFQPYLAPPTDTTKILEMSNNIVLVPRVHQIMKRAWFLKLRSHLENFSNHKTILDIRIKSSTCAQPESKPSVRAPTQPLHYIKHLMVDMSKLIYQEEHLKKFRMKMNLKKLDYQQENLNLMRYIIDNLLWMSHPNTLTLSIPTSFSPTALGVVKKLYGRRNRSCCSGTHDKCWRHFLKYFEVKEEEEEKGHPDALSSPYAHPGKVKGDRDEKKDKLTKLIFIFTWKFQ